MLDLPTNQKEWLLNHLGHSEAVHNQHYRQHSGLVEKVHITKLLLIQDLGLTCDFQNLSLDNIKVEGKSPVYCTYQCPFVCLFLCKNKNFLELLDEMCSIWHDDRVPDETHTTPVTRTKPRRTPSI